MFVCFVSCGWLSHVFSYVVVIFAGPFGRRSILAVSGQLSERGRIYFSLACKQRGQKDHGSQKISTVSLADSTNALPPQKRKTSNLQPSPTFCPLPSLYNPLLPPPEKAVQLVARRRIVLSLSQQQHHVAQNVRAHPQQQGQSPVDCAVRFAFFSHHQSLNHSPTGSRWLACLPACLPVQIGRAHV